jgi:hypothetical protein
MSFLFSEVTTASIHWGTPSPRFQERATTTVYCHGYAELPLDVDDNGDEYVESPDFLCLGHEWNLRIYPGQDDMEYVLIWLMSKETNRAISVDFCFAVKYGDGVIVKRDFYGPFHFEQDETDEWGNVRSSMNCQEGDFATKAKFMSSLVNGTLVIEVQMRLADSTAQSSLPPAFVPENPNANCHILRGLFLNEKYADVVFEIEGDNNNSEMMEETAITTFPAHRFVLESCPNNALSDLCEAGGGMTGVITIYISGVSQDIFRHVLWYLYGGKVEHDDMKSHAKEILDAADRFGVTNLKLEAEASFVASTTIALDNVMEILLYAHSKNCALLKEAAIDFIVSNRDEVLKKVPLNNVPPGLYSDFIVATSRGVEQNIYQSLNLALPERVEDITIMSISELRWKAHIKGLEVDGSREMLIAALNETEEMPD